MNLDDTKLITKELKTSWKFRKLSDNEWYPANVPGTVHTDLYDNGLIPDPFSAYEKYVGRFMSEYGFQSLPLYSTVESFSADSDRYLVSPVYKNGKLDVHLVSDNLEDKNVTLKMALMNFYGNELRQVIATKKLLLESEHTKIIRTVILNHNYGLIIM